MPIQYQPPATPMPPGGSDTEIQYNNAGVFGGVPYFLYDSTIPAVTIDAPLHFATDNLYDPGTALFFYNPIITNDFSKGVNITIDAVLEAFGYEVLQLRSTETNTSTALEIIPHGSFASFPTSFQCFGTDYVSDSSNYESVFFGAKGSGNTYHVLAANKLGTGQLRSIQIEANGSLGATPQLIIGTDGGVSVGTGTAAGSTNLKVAGTINGSNLSGTNTGDNPGVTSIATTSPITGGTITSTGTIAFDAGVDLRLTVPQSVTVNDIFSSVPQDVLIIGHNTTGTPAAGLGTAIQFNSETLPGGGGGVNVEIGEVACIWTDVTHATRSSYITLTAVGSGLLKTVVRAFGSGGISINNATDPGAGYVNANTGYKINNVALAASDVGATTAAIVPNTAPSAGQVLVGNAGGTAYAPSTVSGSGATISLASTGVMTLSAVANATLSNSSITINGASVSLGGSLVGNIQSPVASMTIPDGYSFDIARRYKITGTNNLTIAGNGVFMVH